MYITVWLTISACPMSLVSRIVDVQHDAHSVILRKTKRHRRKTPVATIHAQAIRNAAGVFEIRKLKVAVVVGFFDDVIVLLTFGDRVVNDAYECTDACGTG